MRFLRLALVAVSSVALIGFPSAPAVAGDEVPAAPTARSVLAEINAMRDRRGLRPLRVSRPLTAAADSHTREMGRLGYFRHSSYDGTPFWKRVRQFYPSGGYRSWSAGENLLWVSAGLDAHRAVALWMKSPGHRANILNRRWREIGISSKSFATAPGTFQGYDVTIITTDFGTRAR